jgi:hypothetical protein
MYSSTTIKNETKTKYNQKAGGCGWSGRQLT